MVESAPPERPVPNLQNLLITMTHDFKWLKTCKLLETFWDRRQRKDFTFYDIAELYHENTKLHRYAIVQVALSTDTFMKQPPIIEAATRAFKEYLHCPRVALPREEMTLSSRLDEVIRTRRSIRDYSGEPMTLTELSKLLFYTNGITASYHFTELVSKRQMIQHLRAAPSGGALYPTEIYVAALNVDDLVPGLYHYNVLEHSLETLKEVANLVDRFPTAFPVHPEIVRVDRAALVLVLTTVFERTIAKYGPRGYRYVMQEAGHIAQNVYLVATACGLGAVALAGFFDDELNNWLDVDGVDEAVTYAIVVGRPAACRLDAAPGHDSVSLGEIKDGGS
jgi:SagB-type dehydrogenase family enzyme